MKWVHQIVAPVETPPHERPGQPGAGIGGAQTLKKPYRDRRAGQAEYRGEQHQSQIMIMRQTGQKAHRSLQDGRDIIIC